MLVNELERQMRDLVNEVRAEAGLAPLKVNLELSLSAERHSDWMIDTNSFSHTGVNGSSVRDRAEDAGYVLGGSWSIGENIAYQSERGAEGYADDIIDLHKSLMNSPGHRANILSTNYDEVGIGVEIGPMGGAREAVVVTQNFGRTGADYDSVLDGGETPDPKPDPKPDPEPTPDPKPTPDPAPEPVPDPMPEPTPEPNPDVATITWDDIMQWIENCLSNRHSFDLADHFYGNGGSVAGVEEQQKDQNTWWDCDVDCTNDDVMEVTELDSGCPWA